jgi:hypothetical protein
MARSERISRAKRRDARLQPRSSRDGAAEDAGARASRSGDDDGSRRKRRLPETRERPCGVRASRVARLFEIVSLGRGVAESRVVVDRARITRRSI